MPGMTRHPEALGAWIAGAETPDLIRGRNENLVGNDKP
jgi:hypothetical protein